MAEKKPVLNDLGKEPKFVPSEHDLGKKPKSVSSEHHLGKDLEEANDQNSCMKVYLCHMDMLEKEENASSSMRRNKRKARKARRTKRRKTASSKVPDDLYFPDDPEDFYEDFYEESSSHSYDDDVGMYPKKKLTGAITDNSDCIDYSD